MLETVCPSWEDAKKYCEDLNVDDFSDWRLPSINELHTIADYSPDSEYHPSIYTIFYGNNFKIQQEFFTFHFSFL